MHAVFELDGKIWRTLRNLVVHPGLLSVEYAAGTRRSYINPLRLLITAILIYAYVTSGGVRASISLGPVALSIAPTTSPESASVADTVRRIDRFGILEGLLKNRERSAELESESTRARFHQHLEKFSEPLSFANVIMLAFALCLIFHRSRPLFVENAAFSAHLMTFMLLSSLLFGSILLLPKWGRIAAVVLLLGVFGWQFMYLTWAIRRFYFAGHPRRLRATMLSVGAAMVVYVLNSVFITAVQLAGGAIALLRL